MKTVRLLYPDFLSGGLETYYFGANLLTHILPANENQPLLKVEIDPPGGKMTIRRIKMYNRSCGYCWIYDRRISSI